MKGPTEGKVRKALLETGLEPLVYKPPDDARNWKPCDFMVWYRGDTGGTWPEDTTLSAWIEVKEVKAVGSFPVAELRPSQRGGMRDAAAVGIPYYLVLWWKARGVWTITAAWLLGALPAKGSIPFAHLAGGAGIDAPPRALASVLAAVLRGEVL